MRGGLRGGGRGQPDITTKPIYLTRDNENCSIFPGYKIPGPWSTPKPLFPPARAALSPQFRVFL